MVEEMKKCKRAGCNKQYKDSENSAISCKFHSGQPIFHDLKKGWSCCNVIVYEWAEFEKIEPCCTGLHSDQVEETDFWKSKTVENASNALEKERIAQMKTAADFNKEQEEKKRKEEAEKAQDNSSKKPVLNKEGRFVCANKGCSKKTFTDEENTESACNYHAGEPVFHDLKKYWSCCQKVTYDWDDFMKLPTCAVGNHQYKYK